MFEIDSSLAPEVMPLAFLVGSFHGVGTVAYPGIDEVEIGARVRFSHDEGPYLKYEAVLSTPDAVWSAESGFWRIPPQVDFEVPSGAHPVEVLLADPSGYVTVYVGVVRGARIDLASDLMARTHSGAEVAGARRMYGLVDSRLLWAWDLAAFGHDLQSYVAVSMDRE